jgi:hypothetical protein
VWRYGESLMMHVRRALGTVAAIWLSCQLATLALTPVMLWAGSTDVHAQECTCAHGADALCPMHHKSAPGSKPCVMQSTSDHAAVVSMSLFGIVGVVPGSVATTHAAPSGRLAIVESQMTAERPVPPDPPPPRA